MTAQPTWRLKTRRKVRSLPPVRVISVVRQVVAHPSNEGARWTAVQRSIAWQWRSRTRADPLDLVVYGGLTLRAYPRSNSASNVIYFTPYFDPDEMDFLGRVLKSGDAFVDCGANIGTYSLLAASIVGPSGSVMSYEPSARSAERLRENVAINGLNKVIHVRQAAVGAERGIARITSGSDVSNSIVSATEFGRVTEEIEVVPLDEAELPFTPSIVKIDVEGYEMEALRGMSSLLEGERRPVLLIEFTPHLLRKASTSATELASHLADLDYVLHSYSKQKGKLAIVDLRTIEHRQANYLTVPEERIGTLEGQLQDRMPKPGAGSESLPGAHSPRGYDLVKRAIDVTVSAVGLVVSAPVQLVTAGVVLVSHGSPVLFRQLRPGKDGVVFEMVKFRTMRHPDATHVTDADRLTAVGRFLRSTSLDELPTLWNVLKGEMSLVGPRPLLVEYLPRYSADQARRHEVRPGVTGLAQVSGRNGLSWEDKFALDVEYVDRRSLRLDMEILLRTVRSVLGQRGISGEGEATMSPFTGSQGRSQRDGVA
jgi:FkbM family methyltransferase